MWTRSPTKKRVIHVRVVLCVYVCCEHGNEKDMGNQEGQAGPQSILQVTYVAGRSTVVDAARCWGGNSMMSQDPRQCCCSCALSIRRGAEQAVGHNRQTGAKRPDLCVYC